MNRRLAAILAVGLLPWSLVFAGDELTLVFAFGLVDPQPFYLTDIVTYVTVYTRGLPQFLEAWPLGVGIYVLAIASAISGILFDREDRRVTALLLVIVGLTQLSFAWGFSRRNYTFAVPLGTLLCWTVVWWFDWKTLRDLAPASQ
ncbi:TIGR04206 family protein [Salinibaculum rarum]|uniref:TIGR04206 family protein n=1 Tax=Salinibaculum rarum TaxID=3058903 RepID=UPI00265E85D6|nr:TIGR04206 family protein [Salinibaculum sp. KK48]